MNTLKRIGKFVAGVFRAFVAFVFFTLSVYIAATVMSSGYEYRLVGNKIMRAWHVRLPGYEPYLDFNVDPAVYRQRFVMRSYYRVGPWFEPEYGQEEPNDAKH